MLSFSSKFCFHWKSYSSSRPPAPPPFLRKFKRVRTLFVSARSQKKIMKSIQFSLLLVHPAAYLSSSYVVLIGVFFLQRVPGTLLGVGKRISNRTTKIHTGSLRFDLPVALGLCRLVRAPCPLPAQSICLFSRTCCMSQAVVLLAAGRAKMLLTPVFLLVCCGGPSAFVVKLGRS